MDRPPSPPEAPPAGARTLPRRFGRYMLFDRIGQGGMAEIFLARSTTELGGARLSVVKQILAEYADNAEFAEMLIHEAKLAARLNHANVAQVFDLGREEGQLFIAMEYVEGFDLNALLRACTKQSIALPVEFALYVVACALRALDFAHRRNDDQGRPLGIVHRDVSPSNLLVSFDGEVKLCDFGIAHANDLVTGAENVEEAIKGKAGYMSPEHANGEVLDARADVFAAGIVLWELLAGRRMYRQDQSRATLLEQARKAEIPELPERGLPAEKKLHAIVLRALARDKADRFPSAGAMLRELEGYVAAAGLTCSPLRLGEWLVAHFGEELILRRRMRERAAAAVARGPLVQLTPIGMSERVLRSAPEAVGVEDPPARAVGDVATGDGAGAKDDTHAAPPVATSSSAPPPSPRPSGTTPVPASASKERESGTERVPLPAGSSRDVAPPESLVGTIVDVSPESSVPDVAPRSAAAAPRRFPWGIALMVIVLSGLVAFFLAHR